jgi:translation initiation factor eIF-2B subunit delta
MMLDVCQDNYIDPAVVTLGLKFADWLVVGANKRTQAILQALCKVVVEYECEEMVTSADLSRNLDQRLKPLISYLVACRPISIGMGNAIRWLKSKIAHLPANLGVQEAKEHLEEHIQNYIMEKIVFADRIISKNAAAKIRGAHLPPPTLSIPAPPRTLSIDTLRQTVCPLDLLARRCSRVYAVS